MIRLTLKLRAAATLAKAVTASGHWVPTYMARAKSFNETTAGARHAQDIQSFHQRLNHNETQALYHYTDKHVVGPNLNNLHRWGELKPGDSFTPKIAKHADRALNKARIGEKHGIILHRGIAGAFAAKMAAAHDAHQKDPSQTGVAGTSFTEKGYLSTSLVPHIAHRFAHQLMDPENAVTVHHIIHAHHGTHFGSVQSMSQAPDEHEMLGARGAHMVHTHFTEHPTTPEAHAIVAAHAAKTGRTVGMGPGQVRPPRHFILHSYISGHEQ